MTGRPWVCLFESRHGGWQPSMSAETRNASGKNSEQRPADAYAMYERLLSFLPVPGSPLPAADERPLDLPDPTVVYRRPNAPRPRPEASAAVPAPTASGPGAHPADAPGTRLRDAIKAAVED